MEAEEECWTRPDLSISSEVGPRIKGVIFDLDGTLLSTLPLIVHCFTEVYREYLNKTVTPEEIIASFGPTARNLIHHYGKNLPNQRVQQAVKDYYDCYRKNSSSKILIFPGIPELLGNLRKAGRHLAVVTGVERALMEYTLNSFNLLDKFEATIAGDDVQRPKPDPEGLQLVLAKIGVQRHECMFIGDSPADVQAGKAAGMLTAAALWSPEGKGDPSEEGPDYKFRSVQELSHFLMPSEKKEDLGFYFATDL